jgi:hypothetical protein
MNDPGPDPDAALAELVRQLLPRLRRWTGDSWAVPAAGGGSRGDATAAAVQRLADVGADAEGQPRRPVPRLADITLADQLAVMVEDIRRTGDPAALRTAAAELATLRAALGVRR